MTDHAKFWDRIAGKYARRPVPDEAVYRRKLEITRGYLTPESRVLELGCGTGTTAIAHAPHAGHIRATDISAAMLEIARRKAAEAGVTNVSFQQGSVEDLAVDEGSVDMVLALSLLHLLEHREAAIARIWRMLKPGGVFVSSTACIGDRMAFMKAVLPVGRWFGLVPYVRVFRQTTLERELAAAGFTPDQVWRPEKAIAAFIVARKPAAI